MPYAVVLEDVWKVYGRGHARVLALRGVTLRVPEARLIAVVGPSGSGKTTLLNLVAGLDRPTRGRVWVLGKRIDSMSEDELARFRRSRIGFVFQQFHLIETLTALENVEVPLIGLGVPARERRRRARELLKWVGLEGKEYRKPGELSGGEQQRVGIARALAYNPKLVLADEPTGNLDTVNARQIMEIFRRLVDEKKVTVIVSTHDLELLRYVDGIVRLRDGRVVGVEGDVEAE